MPDILRSGGIALANHQNFVVGLFRRCILLFELGSFRPAPQEKLSLSFEPVIERSAELALALAIQFVGSLPDPFLRWLPPVCRLVPSLLLSQFLLPPLAKVKAGLYCFSQILSTACKNLRKIMKPELFGSALRGSNHLRRVPRKVSLPWHQQA